MDDLGAMFPPDGVERSRVLMLLETKYEKLKVEKGDQVTYVGIELTRDRTANVFLAGMKKRIEKVVIEKDIDTSTASKENPA